MAGEINKKRITMPNGQQYVLNPDEQTVVQPDTRYQNSVTPHSRPLETPVDESGVIRSNRVAQRNAEQQARMAAAANSPVANNVQQVVDAAQVAPAGAVGNDSPDIQKANLFAKKYAPMLRGEEVKPAGEQLLADRTAKYQNQLMPKTPAKTVDPNSDTDGMNSILGNWTSKEDEEKYRKASVARQRIMAVADALRHIGNIYHTTKYAPSQKFNSPVEQERARYQQEKALRDKANERIMTYQMAKAAQDQKAKQWEAEQKQKADQWRATYIFNANKAAAEQAEKKRQFDETLKLKNRMADDAKAKAEADRKLRDIISKRSTGLGYANLNQRKAEFEHKKQNGGGGRKLPEILHGIKGTYSKNMTANELKQIYNQTYDEFERRGIIKRDDVLAGLPADIFGQKTLSEAAKREAVDRILMQNGEVGDWIEENYETFFSPRSGYGDGSALQPQQQSGMNGYIAPGNTWSAPKGNPFDERSSGNTKQSHKDNPFG